MTTRPSVLIVDDEPVIQLMISEFLTDEFTLHTAATGEEAIAAVEAGEIPDLIVMDVQMPGIGGYDACRRIKELTPDGVPVIFLSAHNDLGDILKGYEMGGDDYLTKPVNKHQLQAKAHHNIELHIERCELAKQACTAGNVAMQAMSTSSELGEILRFMQDAARIGELTELHLIHEERLMEVANRCRARTDGLFAEGLTLERLFAETIGQLKTLTRGQAVEREGLARLNALLDEIHGVADEEPPAAAPPQLPNIVEIRPGQ